MATNKIEISITPKLVVGICLPIILISVLIGILSQINQGRNFQKFLKMKAQVEFESNREELRRLLLNFNAEDKQQLFALAASLNRINLKNDYIETLQLILVQKDSYLLIEWKNCCNNENSCESCDVKTTNYLDPPKENVISVLREGKIFSDHEMFKQFYKENYRQSIGIVIPVGQTSSPAFLYATYSWYP